MRVTVHDGKYTVVQDERGGLRALRYGDCCGDGLILALAQEVEALRAENERLNLRIPVSDSGNPYGVRPGASW
jgi:hypothetical protein